MFSLFLQHDSSYDEFEGYIFKEQIVIKLKVRYKINIMNC